MKKKNKYIKNVVIILITLSCFLFSQKFANANSKLNKSQREMITQAKALESKGLIDEAISAYSNILLKYPNLNEAFRPLKNIYIRSKNIKELNKIAEKYLLAHKNNISSQLEVFDIYIITNNPDWEVVINNLYNKEKINLSYMKKVFSILLNNDKKEVALSWIDKIRNKSEKYNFYSLEMGMYLSLKLDFSKSMDEYLLYLKYSPNNIKMITQRIMLLADYDQSINIIKNKLKNAEIKESKIILSRLEFKLKNYQEAYNILSDISNIDQYKINLVEDLIKINEYNLAQIIIGDIISSSKNKKIIDKSIYQLASLYEMQGTQELNEFTITKNIYKNNLLNSPFIKLNSDYSDLLFKAINIYDSLRVYNKDYKSSFQLAEIKYKVQGDLDGAENIYKNIYKNFKSENYMEKSLAAIININLSKGNIENTINKINSFYSSNNKINRMLNMKKVQTYFYSPNKDSLIHYSQKILKDLPKDDYYYNDILDILSLFHLYSEEEIKIYAQANFKLIQNKRTQAIEILNTINKDNPLYNLAQFDAIYLETKQQNYDGALEKIQNMERNNTYYQEQLMILEAEIYDYGLNSKSKAVDIYLNFLELFPQSIFYDLIRIRLRELAL